MTVRRSIPVALLAFVLALGGQAPAGARTGTPSPGFAYVPNFLGSSVSVVDIASGSVATTIDVDGYPFGTTVSPDGGFVFITYFGEGGLDDGVHVIDTASRTVIDSYALGDARTVEPNAVAVDVARGLLYVTESLRDALAIIDLSAETDAISEVPVGDNPIGVTIGPGPRAVYVANKGDGTVSVVDPDIGEEIDVITVGDGPTGIEADGSSGRIFVTNQSDGTVSVIDGKARTMVRTVDLPDGATPIGISVRPGIVAVSNLGTGGIVLINPSTLTVSRILAIDGTWGIDTAKDGRLVVTFVADSQAGIIRVGKQVSTRRVTVGLLPLGVGRFIAR